MHQELILRSNDEHTQIAVSKGVTSWESLLKYIRALPYGRVTDRSNISMVLTEGRGSCSSKHALLKELADLNGIPDVELVLCLYKMNKRNTPGIKDALDQISIDYIPEAHTYLRIKNRPYDFTSPDSNFSRIANDILEELTIVPSQVSEFKVTYHQEFIRKWIVEHNVPYDFATLWEAREQCIKNLSE